MSDEYEDTRFCDNCDKYTTHRCKDSDHERDSSMDYQECLVCHWYMTGYDRRYNKPFDWPDDDSVFSQEDKDKFSH